MKVLVIGSGGREHAICWKLKSSSLIKQLFCAPGNPGTAEIAHNVNVSADNCQGLLEFAQENKIDFTIVGPEVSLSLGVVDLFRKNGLNIFGATKAGAQLESSKAFTKELAQSIKVPTASFGIFESLDSATSYLDKLKTPIVLKADGLAAGKGVMIVDSIAEAKEELKSIFKTFNKVVIEEFLEGVEASYIVATDGEQIVPLAVSHDYKRLNDGQTGPNTGGMGSVSPSNHLTEEQGQWTLENIIRPVIKEMARRGTPFSGFLYAGLMISPKGKIDLIEFNTRLGDPECQVIMRRLDSDLLELLMGLNAQMELKQPVWKKDAAVCVVLSASGYPENPRKGDQIHGLEQVAAMPNVVAFHAGTKAENRKILTNGGRVLNITATANSVEEARRLAYKACDMIQFNGRHCRSDVGL